METVFRDATLTSVRFQCDCMWAGHSMAVSIERSPDGRIVMCSFVPYLAGKPRFWWRVKQAIKCLRGVDGELGDFILAEKDYPELVNLVSDLVMSRNTSGT